MERLNTFEFVRFITVIGIRDIFLRNLRSPFNEYIRHVTAPGGLITCAFAWDETPEGVCVWSEIHIAWCRYFQAVDAKEKSDIIKKIYSFINSHISNETNYYTLY